MKCTRCWTWALPSTSALQTAIIIPRPVSYTHLDVYKRQWMPPALKVLAIAAVSFFGFIVVVNLVRIIIAFVSDAVALLKSFIPFI